jgi:hypothetical protein
MPPLPPRPHFRIPNNFSTNMMVWLRWVPRFPRRRTWAKMNLFLFREQGQIMNINEGHSPHWWGFWFIMRFTALISLYPTIVGYLVAYLGILGHYSGVLGVRGVRGNRLVDKKNLAATLLLISLIKFIRLNSA